MRFTSNPTDDRLLTRRALTRRMAALDPVDDHEELTRLSLEVRYGDALFAHAAYTVAFIRQVALPSIARIVYRTGTGDLMQNVRRRNDHTLLFFGEMLRNGYTHPAGKAAIDRMEQIHSRFGITDDDKLYTLASLALEADRITEHLGLDIFTPPEMEARFRFWRGVGQVMELQVPETRAELVGWTHAYEDGYAYTDGGRALVDQLFADWRERWFRGPLRRYSDDILLAILDEPLRTAHRLPHPPAWAIRAVPPLLRAYARLQALRPHRLRRSWVDHFGGIHGQPLQITDYGHQGRQAVQR